MVMLQLTVVVHVFIVMHELAVLAVVVMVRMQVMVVVVVVVVVVGIGNVVINTVVRRRIVLLGLLSAAVSRLGEIGEHEQFVLLLAPNVIGQARVRVVDAHRAAQVALRVLDPFQLVHAQLQDPLAHLALLQLGRDHRDLGPVAADRGRRVRRPEHVRVILRHGGGAVRWQGHGDMCVLLYPSTALRTPGWTTSHSLGRRSEDEDYSPSRNLGCAEPWHSVLTMISHSLGEVTGNRGAGK